MTRALSRSDRRAMADAVRHMLLAGIRITDIQRAGVSGWQIRRSLENIVVLSRRDGIGAPSVALAQANRSDAVTPRQVTSRAGGISLLPELAGCDGVRPVAPAPFSGRAQCVDGFEQGGVGDGIGRELFHSVELSRRDRGRHPVSAGGVTA